MLPQDTRKSLLQEVQSGSDVAWRRLADLYHPFIASWARKHTSVHQDAEDLAQEILLAVFRGLPGFAHNGRRGAFRCWLRTLTVHRTQDFWAERQAQVQGSGDTAILNLLHDLDDPSSALTLAWEREHDEYVLGKLLEEVAIEFEPQSMIAFRRQSLEGVPADEVARELGISIASVYTAKSRVLRRLRELSEFLLDWDGDALVQGPSTGIDN